MKTLLSLSKTWILCRSNFWFNAEQNNFLWFFPFKSQVKYLYKNKSYVIIQTTYSAYYKPGPKAFSFQSLSVIFVTN